MTTTTGEQHDVDPLVVARRVVNQTLARWPWMACWKADLESDACLGATTALLSHDPAKGASLAPRMHRRATGAVLDGVRDRAPVSRAEWARGVRQDDLPPWRRFTDSLEEIREYGVDPAGPADHAEATASADRVEWLIAQLTPRQARIVRDRYVHGMTNAEISRALGVTDANITKLHHAAMERLRTVLAGHAAAGRAP